MEKPKRKHPRLKNYDYSLPEYYYVTIHAEKDAPRLSEIKNVEVHLTGLGEIAKEQLFALQDRYPNVIVDKYVIMPTHIHAIIRLMEKPVETQRPTLTDVVCAYKSLTTRQCNQQFGTPGRKLFQISFYETVLRNEWAYQECWKYIDGNPGKWLTDPEDI